MNTSFLNSCRVPGFGAVKILFGATRDAGIVDEHIELAEVPGGGGYDRGPTLLLGHIERFEPRRAANGICHLTAFVLQYVGDHYLGAFAREHARRGRPHPGGCAGDDGDLARESHGSPPFFRVVLSGR
jgi:hypothetical protein